ncbi:efflux RND transporter periplasmic adaptor subunit [Paracoccus limosus]|uniref:Efflux RND transporter periplasmic adaptor subunit n=1 Tax=Paracoccus limosus TaxID=913252 RepID=A0A844H3A4_9RHOB|nr:efflux RND transporter periplasmic adaptor subunit [Paracoccus limosus]MTH35346.1 efflux RND transporter periplasmic adaptor subunit [Paracoccus limosus]
MTLIGRIAAMAMGLGLGCLPVLAPALEADAAAVVQDLPVVTLAPATRERIQERVPVSGSLRARQSVLIHANVSGHEIREIRAEVGDRVKAGDVLAVLADDTLRAQLAQAEAEDARAVASVRQAESQIASAEATLTQAATALERTRALRQSGNASQAVLDQAIATEAAARASSASASDGLSVAQAAQRQAAAAQRIAVLNLDYSRIVAPVDGLVVARGAELGALSGGADPLFTLIDGGEIEMDADVIETALGQIKPGDAALIQVAGLGEVRGRVRLVPAAVDPVTRLGQARIALDADPRLRIGLFAQGWVVTDEREAVTVPASAILSDDSGDRVQVVADGKVESRPVRAGIIWQDRREVISGLSPEETVIARAGAFFRSGDAVRAAP